MSSQGENKANRTANQTLAAYLRGGRLPHALLIEGGNREERSGFARLAAKGALCEAAREERPCGQCRHCKKAEKEIHPDILVFGGTGGAKSFHIDVVRALRQQAFVRPNEAEGKVFVLEGVEQMSPQAQNALLKIIEEPPARVVFVLTCENKAVLLPTILSRAAAISLGGVPGEAQADEGVWKALELLCGPDHLDCLAFFTAYERDRIGFAALLDGLGRQAGELLVREEKKQDAGGGIRRLSSLQLTRIIAIINETASAVAQNGNGLLVTTLFCARVRQVVENR